jgi:PTS system cellobiose-specific IIB component
MIRIKIMLMCAMGLSTGILAKKIEDVASGSKKIDQDYFEVRVASIDEYMDHLDDDIDVLMVGPQVNYKYDELKKAFEERGIATMLIDSMEYGEMDAATILKRAILAQKKFNEK